MLVKTALRTITTLCIQGQCLALTPQLLQVSCLLPSFGRLSKAVLTKCDNCLEVRWTIPHLLRQKVDYRYVKVGLYSSFVYDKQHFHLALNWAIPHTTFFSFFFLPFHNFYTHSHVFSCKINNYQIPLSLSGTSRIFSAKKYCQNLKFFVSGVFHILWHFNYF